MSGKKVFEQTKYNFRFLKAILKLLEIKQNYNRFFNIIENAITHSQSKRPVQIKLMKKQKKVMFIVQDFGIGISIKIFQCLPKDSTE